MQTLDFRHTGEKAEANAVQCRINDLNEAGELTRYDPNTKSTPEKRKIKARMDALREKQDFDDMVYSDPDLQI